MKLFTLDIESRSEKVHKLIEKYVPFVLVALLVTSTPAIFTAFSNLFNVLA